MTYRSKLFVRYKRFWKRKTARRRRHVEKESILHNRHESLPFGHNERQHYGDRWEL